MLEVKEHASELAGIKKELAEVTYQLIKLHDRWSVELEQVARREAEMSRALEHFEAQAKTANAKVEALPSRLSESLVKAMDPIKKTVGEVVQQQFGQEINVLLRDLRERILLADQLIHHHQERWKGEFWRTYGLVIATGLLVGITVGLSLAMLYKPSHEALQQVLEVLRGLRG